MGVQRLPEVRLTIPNSVWPHVEGGPIGQAPVESFSTEREIVSGTLPGQVRAVSGFSIGSGSAVVPQAANGRPFTPWAKSSDRLVSVGTLASLEAIYANGDVEPLGAWKVASAAGAIGAGAIDVPLAEAVYGTNRARLPIPCYPYADAIWIVDTLARQAGYYATPAPTPSTFLSVPGIGGICADVGTMTSNTAPTFTEALGQPGIKSGQFKAATSWDNYVNYLTLNTAGSVFTVGNVTLEIGIGTLKVTGDSTQTVTFEPGLDPNWPLRVQVEIQSSTVPGVGSHMIRARSAHDDTKWSDFAVVPNRDVMGDLEYQSGIFNGLLMSTEADAGLWAAPTADFSLLDAIVTRPTIATDATVWSAIQDTVQTFAAAGWLTRHGVLKVINRHELAGDTSERIPFDVAALAEDIPWTLAADDQADRLVVTWSPVTPPDDPDELLEWAVGDGLVEIPARSTVSYLVDLGGYTEQVLTFRHIDVETSLDFSTWEANTAADGSGTEITTGVNIGVERITTSTVIVTLTNLYNQTIWMVDYDGKPALILRGFKRWEQASQAQIAFGATSTAAKNEITIDLGRLAQDSTTARSIALYMWDRSTVNRWRASSIRIPLDLSLDVGDVLTLTHAPSGLYADAIITRLSLAGRAGQIDQIIDIALLPPVVASFDARWHGATVAEFNTFWANKTVRDFDNDPLKVGV